MEKDDYSFLFDPPKDSNVFTRTLYYPRSPSSPESSFQTIPTSTASLSTKQADDAIKSTLGDNRHTAALSKFTAGVLSSSSATLETVAPFLNSHIPDQVHIPDGRGMSHDDNGDNDRNKVYCYRHQPDLRCQRRTPQEDTMAEIQKVIFIRFSSLILDHGCITTER
jgi:hypothetical protein